MKKGLSNFLALIMVLTTINVPAYAAEIEEVNTAQVATDVTMNGTSYETLQEAISATTTAGDYEIKVSGTIRNRTSLKFDSRCQMTV